MREETLPTIEHNESMKRFETTVGGQLAVADYERQGDQITFTHTEVPEPHEGQGIGQALAKAGLEFALTEKLTVVPRCPFIAAFIEQHPEYKHLVRRDSSS